MPRFGRMGAMAISPWMGWGRGFYYPPAIPFSGWAPAFYGIGYGPGYGRGPGFGRGRRFGRGFGPRFGWGRGFGGGFGWRAIGPAWGGW